MEVRASTAVFPMRVVARLTGLTPDTIRVWERRYEAVKPERTGGNKRRYSEYQVRRLVLLRRATELGHSIGQVARLQDADLQRIVGETAGRSRGSESVYESLVEDYLAAVRNFDIRGAESLLGRTAAIMEPMALSLDFIVPLMRRVGRAWQEGQIKIYHEHIISGQLRSLLGTLMRHVGTAPGVPRLIVSTPPEHLHEFGAIIGAFMAASRGLEPIYLGADMPFDDIAEAATQSGSELILLSIARDCRPDEQESLRSGLQTLASEHEVWLGMPSDHALANEATAARTFHSYGELDRALLEYRPT